MGLARRALVAYTQAYAALRGARAGARTIIHSGASLDTSGGGKITIGANCEIHRGALLWAYGGSIAIGDNTSVNPYAVIYGHGGVAIGAGVRIAAHTVIVSANHVFADRTVPIRKQGLSMSGISIADDVWIGAGARILDGVTVGQGCVVTAGAVVTKSAEPYGVYAGVPARRIAER